MEHLMLGHRFIKHKSAQQPFSKLVDGVGIKESVGHLVAQPLLRHPGSLEIKPTKNQEAFQKWREPIEEDGLEPLMRYMQQRNLSVPTLRKSYNFRDRKSRFIPGFRDVFWSYWKAVAIGMPGKQELGLTSCFWVGGKLARATNGARFRNPGIRKSRNPDLIFGFPDSWPSPLFLANQSQ